MRGAALEAVSLGGGLLDDEGGALLAGAGEVDAVFAFADPLAAGAIVCAPRWAFTV